MTERLFQEITAHEDGQQRPGFRITCSRCDRTDDFYQRGSPRRPPPLAASSHFTHRGWFVANSARKDRCPDCRHKPQETQPMKPSAPETTPPTPPPPPKGHDAAPRAEAPRSMSKDERRIIFAKIDEVYVGPDTGYAAGWNDERLSKDLGVPRAWVATVRDEFFGPERDLAALQALADRLEKLRAEWEDAQKRMADIVAAHAGIASLKAALADFGPKMDALGRELRALLGGAK